MHLFLCWVGLQTQASGILGKHSTNWAIFSASRFLFRKIRHYQKLPHRKLWRESNPILLWVNSFSLELVLAGVGGGGWRITRWVKPVAAQSLPIWVGVPGAHRNSQMQSVGYICDVFTLCGEERQKQETPRPASLEYAVQKQRGLAQTRTDFQKSSDLSIYAVVYCVYIHTHTIHTHIHEKGKKIGFTSLSFVVVAF